MKGRRTSLPRGSEVQVNPQNPAIQAAQDDAVLPLLEALGSELKLRIEKGDLNEMSLVALSKELRSLLVAIRRPNSTLIFAGAPALPQPRSEAGRANRLSKGARGPERESLRVSQRRALEKLDLGENVNGHDPDMTSVKSDA